MQLAVTHSSSLQLHLDDDVLLSWGNTVGSPKAQCHYDSGTAQWQCHNATGELWSVDDGDQTIDFTLGATFGADVVFEGILTINGGILSASGANIVLDTTGSVFFQTDSNTRVVVRDASVTFGGTSGNAAVNYETSSDTNPVFHPEAGTDTTGLGGTATTSTLVVGSVARVKATATGADIAGDLTITGAGADANIIAGSGNLNVTAAAVTLANQVKDLTAGAATAYVKITIPSETHQAGQIHYALHADDGTDFQTRSAVQTFAGVNKAGTITCDMGSVPANFAAIANSAGTTALAFTCSDAGSNVLDLEANATSTLTETTLELHYSITMSEAGVVAPQ